MPGLFAPALIGILLLLFSASGASAKKLYSYQSGNWGGTNIWTTDSTGTTLVGSSTPVAADIVHVLTGRTILLTANVTVSGLVIYISIGATLDMAAFGFTNSIYLNGNGLLRTSKSGTTGLLPTITGGTFLTYEGGTVEYYAATGNLTLDGTSTATYCNLVFTLGGNSQIITVIRNLTIYGYLTVQSGTFQINDASTTKRTITVNGNFTVGAAGKVTTGTGNTNTSAYKIQPTTNLPPGGQFHTIFHELTIGGNFTNNGSVRFTNLTAPDYGEFASNGAVTVRFNGERHATLYTNGITDFYNLIIDKGSDQTYILTVNSTNVNYFALYGPNAVRRNEDPPYSQDNPEVRKALWIKNGTLKLTGNLVIPSLAEGPIGPTGNGDYAIGLNGQLWIAGPNVSVYVTASNATGFPQAPVGSSGVTTLPAAEQALSIYGKFRITDGYFSTRHSAGIIFWNTANSSSVVMVEGGVLNTSVMRSTWTAPGKTSYVQTGGTVYVRGNETEEGEMSGVPIFNIPNPSSTFVMTGGDIIIRDRNNGTATEGTGLYLNCDPGNFSVTGGNITFEVNPANTPSIDIYSRVNMWNLNIKRLGSTGNAVVNMMYPVTVANKLTIFPNATLNSGTGNHNIYSYGDIIINPGGTYTPNQNTTSYVGYDNYFLWNDGTITSGLYNLEVNKREGSLILVSSSPSFTVRNNLLINDGTLADGGKTVYVNGNVINNGVHVGAGKISMNRSTGGQSIGGNGLGVFQNLEIFNTYGAAGSAQVSLGSDIIVTGRLILANDRLFNLDSYRLNLKALATVEGTMSNSRFITTNGNPSAAGISREYTDTTAFVFPLGTGANYTPATVYIRKIPLTYGNVIVKPVPVKHPFTTNATCLPYYWKVEEENFTGIKANSLRLYFNYGILPDNTGYVPGRYNPATWEFTNDPTLVDETTNTISFLSLSMFQGDYTAGIPSAFGTVTSFYSRASGAWSTPSTWSNAGFGGVAATTVPGSSNPVFIGDGATYNHVVTVTAGNAAAGSLSIRLGSALDVGSTSGNNFGAVIPGSDGKLRITTTGATALFPAGDFGNFLGQQGGLVEYYTTGTSFTVPTTSATPTSATLSSYHDISLAPATGLTITLPNLDLTVFGALLVNGGSSTGLARLTNVAARTLSVVDSIRVNSGTLQFQNTMAQIVNVSGNISIATGGIFNVAATGTAAANYLTIGGNVYNDGTLDLCQSATLKCDVRFTGNTDAVIAGRGGTTDFYLLTVDKGVSSIPVLNVTSSAFSFSSNTAPLVLVNGTFRLTSPLSVAVSSGLFEIPPTTALSANGGTLLLATSASDDADIILAGTMDVRAGSIVVGTSTNNNNNDIEYSGAGYPSIEVRGGSLFVNGQVRRSMINGLGSLVYKQSGTSSAVTINGRNCQVTRAKLEVVNSGSIFNMSAGTITIVRGGSTTYNDLYIRPESSTVSGGTIIFGNSSTEATTVNSLTLDSTFPLYNIIVDGTTNPKTLTLAVNPLVLKGSLTINATSAFKADSLSVYIGGNLTNLNTDATTGVNVGGYRPGSFRQVTTFNGSAGNQTLTGAAGNITNLANVVIDNTSATGYVTMMTNTALRINSDLTLNRGIISDGGNIITVIGDIYNSGTHESPTSGGRLLLAGPSVQTIAGNGAGKFGNVYLNSTYDVRMIANTEITGILTFQGKLLDIGHKLLYLSNTSAASIAGTFSATACIRSDGLVSDAGVKKNFPSGAYTFTFPVGVPGKYEYAVIAFTANSAPGTITMIPVNSVHPCITGTSPDTLRFYWHVLRTGFSNPTVTHTFYYTNADVAGTENNYVGDRYLNGVWDSPASGVVSPSNNRITFTNKTFIEGDYTAGNGTLFGTVPVYYSRNATCTNPSVGNWNTNATWSTDAVLQHAGAAATSYPTGEPVVIATNHIVTTNGNSRKTSVMTLNGTGIMDLSNSIGHDFGTVQGTGTIRLTPSATGFFVFPAGNFSTFTAAGGGTVELNNPSGTAVFPYLTTYNNLTLKGVGVKQMIDADITLNGVLTNDAGGNFTASSVGFLTLNSNWVNNGSFTNSGGTTVFNGSTLISGSTPPVLGNVIINAGRTLTSPAAASLGVSGNWTNNGIFNHNSGTVSFAGASLVTGSSVTTFNNLTIQSGKSLTGLLDGDIVVIGNWVNSGTFTHNGGTIVFDGVSGIGGSSRTTFGGVTVNDSRQLTGPAADTMKVSLNFMNNGYFDSNSGTLEFNGFIQSLEGSSSTLFENLKIGINSTTTILAPGQSLAGVLVSRGVLYANDNLTLLSNSERTALIDGSGEGEVYGNVTIQRYLPRGFGYKYFSSPFQACEVGQFGDHMDLYASFPRFYRYDENRMFTGWITYTDPAAYLAPMQGYAVNFGPLEAEMTVDLVGQVNNNTMLPMTLFNRNHPYTKGFNLIGNPYPSPVDWDAHTGWVRDNIDNALYYFDAGYTDQYTGTYSTYINGVSSDGIASNIIPAMQGFFMHVSNGAYPVASTLIFTNEVRVRDQSATFHKEAIDENRPLVRMKAGFVPDGKRDDALVVYFDPQATPGFDPMADALKLKNTDPNVPSLFARASDTSRLSIDGLPGLPDSVVRVPLGVAAERNGSVLFRAAEILRMPPGIFVYFCDAGKGVIQNLNLHPEYKTWLEPGDCTDRFSLVFSRYDMRYQPPADQILHVYSSRNRLFVYTNLPDGVHAAVTLRNIIGQPVFSSQVGKGYTEFDLTVSAGIYIANITGGGASLTKKVCLTNP